MKFKLLINVRRCTAQPFEPDDVQPGFGAGEIVEVSEEEWHNTRASVTACAKPDYGATQVMKAQLLPL